MNQEETHPLQRSYTFWLSSMYGTGKEDKDWFKESLRDIGTFDTVEDFWGYYQHLTRPEQAPEGTQLYLFKAGIQPAWEDEQNKNGGRFIFRVRRAFGNKLWEDVLLSYIGEQCEFNDYICGLVCHTKKGFVQISIWIKNFNEDWDIHASIKNWIFTVLNLKEHREIEFTFHPKHSQTLKMNFKQL